MAFHEIIVIIFIYLMFREMLGALEKTWWPDESSLKSADGPGVP
jgi:hypothetical protein